MIAAADVYTGGTFWLTAVIVVLTVVLLAVTIFAVRKQAPRRRVTWVYGTSTSIIDPAFGPQLEVYWAQPPGAALESAKKLQEPYFTSVIMKNDGRVDVATNSFDAHKPIRMQLGPNVVSAILLSVDTPKSFPVALEETTLIFGPGHLKRNADVQVRLLVDGSPDFTDPLESTLLNWTERTEVSEPPLSAGWSRRRALLVIGIAFMIAALVIGSAFYVTAAYERQFRENSYPTLTPDVRSLPLKDAEGMLQASGFSYIEVDAVVDRSKPAGTVVAQFPAAGQYAIKTTSKVNANVPAIATIIITK